MPFAVFTLDHPAFREALSQHPDLTLQWEQSDPTEHDTLRTVVWAEGGDHDAFEAALEDDPSVATPEQVIDVGDQRIYHIEVTEMQYRPSVYSELVDRGCVIEQMAGTHQGWEFHVTFPDYDAFRSYRQFCEDEGIPMTVNRVYPRQQDGWNEAFGLTSQQRNALVAALEAGYFAVPREVSLADVADRFDISANAASERIRRGTRTLVRNTVATQHDETE